MSGLSAWIAFVLGCALIIWFKTEPPRPTSYAIDPTEVPVSVTGGEWSKNPPKNDCKLATEWTSEPGYIRAADIVCMRVISPGTATLAVAGVEESLRAITEESGE